MPTRETALGKWKVMDDLKGAQTHLCHLPPTQPSVGGTSVMCVLVADSCHRDVLCQPGVSLTLGSHAVHEGRAVPQPIGGCPYPAAGIWYPIIS